MASNTIPAWRNRAGLGATQRVGKVENDHRADWREAWALFPGDVAYVWHGALHATTVAESLTACGFEIRAQIIWAKDRLVLGRGHYHWQHEPCWYAVRRAPATGPATASRRRCGRSPAGRRTPRRCTARRSRSSACAGRSRTTAAPARRSTSRSADRAPRSSPPRMSGRACHAIELSPAYVDVAVLRWQAFTGESATHEPTGLSFSAVAEERRS